jgi:hypothetical protein
VETKRVQAGQYEVYDTDGQKVGLVMRKNTRTWDAYLSSLREDVPVADYGYPNMGQAVSGIERALERGGLTVVKLQPAPRTDHITADGHELTQLPYPLHVLTFNGRVLDDWADCVVGFARDLAKQQVDLWWEDYVKGEPEDAVGMYVVIRTKGQYSALSTAIMKVEVSG